MEPILLSTKNSKIDTIFHLSDIHIRLYQRHEEYREVFQKTFESISKYPKKNNIIVVTGDILHSKIELSPECETMTIDFLHELSTLYPTLFIAGNHDALLNNRQRLDSLSSILYQREKNNLFYLKNTGIYQYDNILFHVDSLLDDTFIDMKTSQNNSNFVSIALFHGSIQGWQNTKGYISDHGEKYIEDFAAMDYVLLGDIHMHQYMSTQKPVSAYAGSLISQNFGETDENHGFLVWDLKKKTQEYVRIPNRFRYQEIYLQSNNLLRTDNKEYTFDKLSVSPNGHVKVFGTEDEIKSRVVFENLKSKWKNVIFYYQSNEQKDLHLNDNIELEEKNTEEDNIRKFVKANCPSDCFDDLFESIMKSYKEYNNYTSKLQWKLLKLKFSNMFGYGKDNEISFSRNFSNQIIGIFGQNSSGKSTLIDIITMLLFDKTTRFNHGQSIPKEVIHFNEKEASGTIELLIGSDIYRIHKKYKRGEKIKQTTKFYVIRDGKEEELTQEQRKKTNKFIEEMIGNFDKFIYTHCFLQQRENSFREMLPSAKKKFLNDLYGFHWFEKMEKSVKEKVKETETRIKIANETLSKKSSLFLTKEINSINSEIDKVLSSIQTKNEQKAQVVVDLDLLYETLLLGLKYSSFEEDYKHFDSEINETMEIISKNKAKQKEMETFLKRWKDDNFLIEWNQFNTDDFFSKWKPGITTISKWKVFYNDIKKNKKEDIQEIQKKLKMFYKQVSEEEIQVNQEILSSYKIEKKKEIKDFVDSFDHKNIQDKLREYYTILQHSLTDLKNNTMWKEKNKKHLKDEKEMEQEIQMYQVKLESFEKYTNFMKEENVKIFISNHEKWKNTSLYNEYSPFFSKSSKVKWNSYFQSTATNNLTKIKEELANVEETLVSIQNNAPSYIKDELISKNEYNMFKEKLKIPPHECKSCQFIMNENFHEDILLLQQTESFLFNLKNDIDFLENNLKECHFEPNPNCSVCLKNPEYENRLLWERKLTLKKKEWKKKMTCRKKILDSLHSSMKQEPDVHVDLYFQQKPSLESLTEFIKYKNNCLEKTKKEQNEYQSYYSLVKNYENFLANEEIRKQQSTLLSKKQVLQKKLDHLYFCIENKNLFEYIQTQWKWFDILPKDMETIKNIFQELQDDNDTLKEKILLLKNQMHLNNKEWKLFDTKWKEDIKTFQEITTLEESIKVFEKYESFLNEWSKKEKKDMNHFYLQEIVSLEKKQEHYLLWKEKERVLLFLEKIWSNSSLWEVDGVKITQKMRETEQDLKKNQMDTFLLEDKIKKLKLDRKELKQKWEHDEKKKIEIRKKKTIVESLETEVGALEEKKVEFKMKKIQFETEIQNWENNKKELYSLQDVLSKDQLLLKMIDKDGLPLFLLKQKMKQMEINMNQLMKHFLPEKEIRFLLQEKNIEFGTINKMDSSILCNYFGGMESFIIDLALKLTFTKFGILPSSNFFVIDEGISVLDQQRQHNITFLFDFLSSITDNVLLISHIPQIRDFVNKSINVEKNDGKSHVKFFLEKKIT